MWEGSEADSGGSALAPQPAWPKGSSSYAKGVGGWGTGREQPFSCYVSGAPLPAHATASLLSSLRSWAWEERG